MGSTKYKADVKEVIENDTTIKYLVIINPIYRE